MTIKEFFVGRDVKQLVDTVLHRLQAINGFDEIDKTKAQLLGEALIIINANAEEFDRHCQINIGLISKSFLRSLEAFSVRSDAESHLDRLYSMTYRFVREYEISASVDLAIDLNRFLDYVGERYSSFSGEAQAQFRFANQDMPIQILKRLLGSEPIRNIVNLKEYSDKINGQVTGWEGDLNSLASRADALKGQLGRYAQAFNFVGLSQAFEALLTAKRKEVRWQRVVLVLLGIAVILPIVVEVWMFTAYFDQIQELRWILAGLLIPVVSWTLLVVYFFRLSVRSIEGIKSQILQLELRRSLCQFIESYADYAKALRKESPGILEKFESVVFSSIVSSDEKIPATFDGLEQLTSLVKSVKN